MSPAHARSSARRPRAHDDDARSATDRASRRGQAPNATPASTATATRLTAAPATSRPVRRPGTAAPPPRLPGPAAHGTAAGRGPLERRSPGSCPARPRPARARTPPARAPTIRPAPAVHAPPPPRRPWHSPRTVPRRPGSSSPTSPSRDTRGSPEDEPRAPASTRGSTSRPSREHRHRQRPALTRGLEDLPMLPNVEAVEPRAHASRPPPTLAGHAKPECRQPPQPRRSRPPRVPPRSDLVVDRVSRIEQPEPLQPGPDHVPRLLDAPHGSTGHTAGRRSSRTAEASATASTYSGNRH